MSPQELACAYGRRWCREAVVTARKYNAPAVGSWLRAGRATYSRAEVKKLLCLAAANVAAGELDEFLEGGG